MMNPMDKGTPSSSMGMAAIRKSGIPTRTITTGKHPMPKRKKRKVIVKKNPVPVMQQAIGEPSNIAPTPVVPQNNI